MHHAECTLQQNELASQPCRDAPVNQATAIPAISASPLPHLDRCAAAYREEYGGNEYGGLPVKYSVFVTLLYCNVFQLFAGELLRFHLMNQRPPKF
jgi:hypothetical protein